MSASAATQFNTTAEVFFSWIHTPERILRKDPTSFIRWMLDAIENPYPFPSGLWDSLWTKFPFALELLLLCFTSPSALVGVNILSFAISFVSAGQRLEAVLCNWSNSSAKEEIHSVTHPGGNHLLAIAQKQFCIGSTAARVHEVLFHFCSWTLPVSTPCMTENTLSKPTKFSLCLSICILKAWQRSLDPWHIQKPDHTSVALGTAQCPAHSLTKPSAPDSKGS